MTITGKFSSGLNDLTSETANSPGPFRNANMSKAAQTHKLRKLRAPSKCRECDSLVVFHGAECEEVSWKLVLIAAWDLCKVGSFGNLNYVSV